MFTNVVRSLFIILGHGTTNYFFTINGPPPKWGKMNLKIVNE